MSAPAVTSATDAIEARPWGRAARWLAFLGPFFFLTYGLATWASAMRDEVGSIVFDWERRIPFVPWTIVPYWSIDVLYAASLFVCRTQGELDTHARRLLTAQAVAVACFLVWPLRFTFERPDTSGAFGWLFDVLGAFDKPFNQAPSLHIALLVILWVLYAPRAHGVWRWLVHGWFALIGVSVLTTWQHHFIDVPTGLLLGVACLWLWPLEGRSPIALFSWTADPQRRRIGAYYAVGAIVLTVLAFGLGGAVLWLLWPAVALLLVALTYLALGPEGFQKRNGHLSPGALALFAPYLLGAWINSRLWTRRRPRPDLIVDGIWLGRMPSSADLRGLRFDAVVDMAAELPVPSEVTDRVYLQFPVLDLVVPDGATLFGAAQAIERSRKHGRTVLVCCALGYSRSAAAVCAWLVATGRAADVEGAVARVTNARPDVTLSPDHRAVVTALRPSA